MSCKFLTKDVFDEILKGYPRVVRVRVIVCAHTDLSLPLSPPPVPALFLSLSLFPSLPLSLSLSFSPRGRLPLDLEHNDMQNVLLQAMKKLFCYKQLIN